LFATERGDYTIWQKKKKKKTLSSDLSLLSATPPQQHHPKTTKFIAHKKHQKSNYSIKLQAKKSFKKKKEHKWCRVIEDA
jgi:hypothetical protein